MFSTCYMQTLLLLAVSCCCLLLLFMLQESMLRDSLRTSRERQSLFIQQYKDHLNHAHSRPPPFQPLSGHASSSTDMPPSDHTHLSTHSELPSSDLTDRPPSDHAHHSSHSDQSPSDSAVSSDQPVRRKPRARTEPTSNLVHPGTGRESGSHLGRGRGRGRSSRGRGGRSRAGQEGSGFPGSGRETTSARRDRLSDSTSGVTGMDSRYTNDLDSVLSRPSSSGEEQPVSKNRAPRRPIRPEEAGDAELAARLANQSDMPSMTSGGGGSGRTFHENEHLTVSAKSQAINPADIFMYVCVCMYVLLFQPIELTYQILLTQQQSQPFSGFGIGGMAGGGGRDPSLLEANEVLNEFAQYTVSAALNLAAAKGVSELGSVHSCGNSAPPSTWMRQPCTRRWRSVATKCTVTAHQAASN